MNSALALAEIQAHLEEEAAEGLFATGGQMYVSVDGQPVMDVAVGVDGLGRDVELDTLFAVYCAGKPAVSVAVATLVAEGELSLDDQLGHVLEGPLHAELAPIQIRHLLSHTAGLYHLPAAQFLATSASRQGELAASLPPDPGWPLGVAVAYSEVSAWWLLGRVVETLAGESVRDAVRRRVLEPAGAEIFVAGMDDDEFAAAKERLGINVALQGTTATPLLTERNRRLRCACDPALASSASARGLGRFYEWLLAARNAGDEGPIPLLRTFTTRRSYGFDQIMNRECAYGYGFMVELGGHYFGSRCSATTFGHSGNGGMTAAFADLEHGLVIAFHFNGKIDSDTAVVSRRPALVDRIYRAVLDHD